MSRLFGRRVALSVVKPNGLLSQGPNATVIRGLRVQFTVEKHLGKEPNDCSFVVSNLAERTRALFDERPLYIRLEAGYDDTEELLFEGDLRFAETIKNGTDWETHCEVGDGHRAFRIAKVNRSYSANVRLRDPIMECIKALGGYVNPAVINSIGDVAIGGLVLEGSAQRELTRLLDRVDRTWSIQNGQIQILRRGETRRDQAAVIQEDKGMIGSPAYGSPPEKGKAPTLTVENLLYPSLVPGGLVQVKSRRVEGLFKVQRVRHNGDTHGPSWNSTIEATPKR